MIKQILIFTALAIHLATFANTEKALRSNDVKAFVDNAEACEHLAGEFDSSLPKADQRTILKNVKIYCSRAYRQRFSLKRKYKNDVDTMKMLNQYESINDYRP